MGEPLDKTRPTRFPKNPPAFQQSQQLNLRELESAILWLQQENESRQTEIAALVKRIEKLEAK